MEAVVHLGLHKTGTSTIQYVCDLNRGLLGDAGILYPKLAETRAHHVLVSQWFRLSGRNRYKAPVRGLWDSIHAQAEPSHGTVFLSSEEFTRAHPKRVDMAAFRKRLAAVDPVEALCVLRDQTSLIQSVYLQVSKKKNPGPVETYLDACCETGHARGVHLDFSRLRTALRDGFEDHEIVFAGFDRVTRAKGGPVGFFLDHLGVARLMDHPQYDPGAPQNVSPDPLGVWVANTVACPDRASGPVRKISQAVLREEFGPTYRGTIFTAPQTERLAAHFGPLNRGFCQEIGETDLEAGLASPPRIPERISPDQLTPQFWQKLSVRLGKRLNAEALAKQRAAAPGL